MLDTPSPPEDTLDLTQCKAQPHHERGRTGEGWELGHTAARQELTVFDTSLASGRPRYVAMKALRSKGDDSLKNASRRTGTSKNTTVPELLSRSAALS